MTRVALVAVLALCSCSTVVEAMITPRGSFDDSKLPPKPDYAKDSAWIALPLHEAEASVALPSLPAIDAASASVDVFYVHSTSSVAPEYNAAADDPEVRAASIRGGTLIQASAFNACCAIYAPEYRQATGTAFVRATKDGDRAIAVAYGDVVAAYEEFIKRTGGTRPFIIAGHSQGSVLLTKLLAERIATTKDRERLVAAYLIGAPVTPADLGGLHACASTTETGCVITFNARAPGYKRNGTDFGRAVPDARRICVNPTLGFATTTPATPAEHRGAVFFDAETPALLPHFLASRCERGRLVVEDLAPIPSRGMASDILLAVLGGKNFHPVEYQLFYADLRNDASRRVDAFRAH
jgi:hypothetical protein